MQVWSTKSYACSLVNLVQSTKPYASYMHHLAHGSCRPGARVKRPCCRYGRLRCLRSQVLACPLPANSSMIDEDYMTMILSSYLETWFVTRQPFSCWQVSMFLFLECIVLDDDLALGHDTYPPKAQASCDPICKARSDALAQHPDTGYMLWSKDFRHWAARARMAAGLVL